MTEDEVRRIINTDEVGCFKGKEIHNYIHGHLASDIQNFKGFLDDYYKNKTKEKGDLNKSGCEYGRTIRIGYENLTESMVREAKRMDELRDTTLPRLFKKLDSMEGIVGDAKTIVEETREFVRNQFWRDVGKQLIPLGVIVTILILYLNFFIK